MNMLTDPTNDELMGMWNELMASVPESNANILGDNLLLLRTLQPRKQDVFSININAMRP